MGYMRVGFRSGWGMLTAESLMFGLGMRGGFWYALGMSEGLVLMENGTS